VKSAYVGVLSITVHYRIYKSPPPTLL